MLEIGHSWVAPAAWGTGANTEAKLLLLVARVRASSAACGSSSRPTRRNERSRAALAAIPATFEGVFRKHMLVRGGQRRDSAWYSVIDDDWPAVKAALQARVAAKA